MGFIDDAAGPLSEFLGMDVQDPLGTNAANAEDMEQKRQALGQTDFLADEARSRILGQTSSGLNYLTDYGNMGAGEMRYGRDNAIRDFFAGEQAGTGAINQGAGQSLGALGAGYGAGRGDLSQGYGQAQGSLAQGYGAGRGALAGGYDQGRGDVRGALGAYDVTRAQDRVGGMLDQRGGLYGGFESDPGYQFRQQQGEEAINRAAAARGGRGGARTQKALAEFNSGLASQEFGNFANRRQAEAGLASGSDAQRGNLLQSQAGRYDAAGNSLANLAAQRGQGLAGLYGAQGQGISGLQARQGEGLAGMSTGLADRQSGVYGAQGQSLADLAKWGAGARGNASMQTGQDLGNLYTGVGSNLANTTTMGSALDTSLTQKQMEGWSDFASGKGPNESESENRMNIASIIASIFSDRRLKTEIKEVPGSKYERIGLKGYRWKWNEKAVSLGLDGIAEGVIAQETREKHPHAVLVSPSGYLMVDYAELDRLIEAAPVLPPGLDREPLHPVSA